MFELMPYPTRRVAISPFAFFGNDFWNSVSQELKTDITDAGDSFKLEADLPGFNRDDIKIDLIGERLTVSAERKSETEEKETSGYIRRERSYGSFKRSFDVSNIDTSNISASYNDGVLCMTLPKKSELVPENRTIAIS